MNETWVREASGEHESLYTAHNRALIQLARQDLRVVTCYADFPSGEAGALFKAEFPDRIIDVGIAEAHLITSAAGLSDAGFIPFTHCHCLFALGRGYNQIRQNLAYDQRNVKIVLCNSGAVWGDIGPSHISVEDIPALRAIPRLAFLSPSDPVSCEKATVAAAEYQGPVAIRLPAVGEKWPTIYADSLDFQMGKAYTLREGRDVALLVTGILAHDALEAARGLARDGIEATVLDVQTIKPLDEEAVLKTARETGAVVTVEDGSIVGGLGGAVAELLGEKHPTRIRRIGMRDLFGESGKPHEIKEHYGLTAGAITQAVRELLQFKR